MKYFRAAIRVVAGLGWCSRLLLLSALSGGLSGCVTVQPWERGTLADPMMIFDENPIDKGIQEHHLDYREGSVGGTGAQAGGCGCG